MSVLGIHTGSVVHVLAATVGISALLMASATAFNAVKLAGATYLVNLGIRRLAGRVPDVPDPVDTRSRMGRVYGNGIIVNVLNPKTALFFLAFLPQFVDPRKGPTAPQFLILGACFIAIGLCTDSAYAFVAGSFGTRIRSSGAFRATTRLSGITYIGLGIAAAATGRGARRPAH